jgi:hypothetical protein
MTKESTPDMHNQMFYSNQGTKHQAPNTTHQTPNTKQAQNTKRKTKTKTQNNDIDDDKTTTYNNLQLFEHLEFLRFLLQTEHLRPKVNIPSFKYFV